jgi:hypothetical protein
VSNETHALADELEALILSSQDGSTDWREQQHSRAKTLMLKNFGTIIAALRAPERGDHIAGAKP